MKRSQAFRLVNEARDSAEAKLVTGDLDWTSAVPDCPTELWLAALMEELGEVARCVHDGTGDLRLELAQLAGVAIGRLETL